MASVLVSGLGRAHYVEATVLMKISNTGAVTKKERPPSRFERGSHVTRPERVLASLPIHFQGAILTKLFFFPLAIEAGVVLLEK